MIQITGRSYRLRNSEKGTKEDLNRSKPANARLGSAKGEAG